MKRYLLRRETLLAKGRSHLCGIPSAHRGTEVLIVSTTRCRNSELWFANNPELENAILSYAAKYQERYDITLYGFAIEGNHIQFPLHFPKLNRGDFMRDLNLSVAQSSSR
ncbi:MAG: hypothetical protein IT290_05885 [Deltaproteobacteria bacterium]|nr:hypothetical protein [Deltaproteobacteria bacterium]